MGQSMSRVLELFNSYILVTGRRRRQQENEANNNNGITTTEYSDDMSTTIAGGGKGCVSMSGGGNQTYFGNHFLMGGELYDTTKPDMFLFGDQQDLELLGNKPVKFPYSAKGVTDTVNVINVLVNARRDSIKFTKVGRAGTSYSSGFYRLEFIFDCDVSCFIQIHFCAKEFIDEHQQIQIVGRQNHQFNSSERYHFPVGANQQFSHFIFKPHRYDLKQMHWDGGLYFPLIIEIRSVTDRFPEQMQMTMCSIERSADQSAALILKPLKQKLISNGVVFLLQEIFGIENKENAESALAEENGAECIICMANSRDTMILPCRHLCICNGCAETLRYKLNNCPICRSPFKALLKIKAIRSSLVGMGSDGIASTMRIRREPLTLFEAINGPFYTGSTTIVLNKTQTLAKCTVGGNVVTTSTIPTSTNEMLNTNCISLKLSNIQRKPTINPEPIKMIKRWDHQNEKMELDIEQIELEEMDSKRRKVSNSAGFIQYSPGENSITRRSSPSPPHSLWRAQSPFSTPNSSYQSARSIAQKVQSGEEQQEKNNKIGNELLLASAPNLISKLEEGISVENEQERKVEKIENEKKIDEKRIKIVPMKRLNEPPTASTSSSSSKSSSIPVKQRHHKTMKAKSLTENKM